MGSGKNKLENNEVNLGCEFFYDSFIQPLVDMLQLKDQQGKKKILNLILGLQKT